MNTIDHQYWAREILKFLVKHIREFEGGKELISYGELAKQVGYPEMNRLQFSGSIGRTLGILGKDLIEEIKEIDDVHIPYIQVLVVNKKTYLPGDGIKGFLPNYTNDIEKKERVVEEIEKIIKFGTRWEKLLDKLGISDLSETNNLSTGTNGRYNPYGSKGSPEHRNLIAQIANNPPSVFNLDSGATAYKEFLLASGDRIDVVFKTDKTIVAIEVKSKRSGYYDIERGLYQCVKYEAVLKAQYHRNVDIKCFLALETDLPIKLKETKNRLDINVIENIYTILKQ